MKARDLHRPRNLLTASSLRIRLRRGPLVSFIVPYRTPADQERRCGVDRRDRRRHHRNHRQNWPAANSAVPVAFLEQAVVRCADLGRFDDHRWNPGGATVPAAAALAIVDPPLLRQSPTASRRIRFSTSPSSARNRLRAKCGLPYWEVESSRRRQTAIRALIRPLVKIDDYRC